MIETKTEAKIRRPTRPAPVLPVSVIVPARNEARNLQRCLASLTLAGEIYVVDSGSVDDTVRIAESYGATVVQFHYRGGWPKKRQWAMDTLPLSYDWILLLDADEVLTRELAVEIQSVIQSPDVDGYYIALEMYFLGRRLRHSGASFSKLSLFRKGRGRFECRLHDQDTSMADMEVHEHVIVDGTTRHLRHPLVHHNVESLDRYIQKHNEYSNWKHASGSTARRPARSTAVSFGPHSGERKLSAADGFAAIFSKCRVHRFSFSCTSISRASVFSMAFPD